MQNKPENPFKGSFSELTKEQRMSAFNLYYILSICEGKNDISDNEIIYLGNMLNTLEVENNECVHYFKRTGHQKIIEDLKEISLQQKELLVIFSWDFINCNGRPSETKINTVDRLFEMIGIDDEKYVQVITKFKAINDLYRK